MGIKRNDSCHVTRYITASPSQDMFGRPELYLEHHKVCVFSGRDAMHTIF